MISHILGMERNFTCRVGEEMDNNEGEGLILTMFGMHFLGVGNLSSSSSYPRALLSYLILHTIIDVVVFRFLAILSRKSLFSSPCWELELQSCPRLRQAVCVKGAYGAVGVYPWQMSSRAPRTRENSSLTHPTCRYLAGYTVCEDGAELYSPPSSVG